MIKSISVLVFIVAARFYGLFVVLPILSVYAKDFSGANALIIGLIVGAYAIAQIIFQLPFGRLSDKIGRKKALALGFVVFLAGSLICAISSDVYTMILGRFIQGAGAVGAVASAFIADLSAAHQRGRAMAAMGVGIGLSFSAAMISGPLLASSFGISALFYLCAIISLLCLALLTLLPSNSAQSHTKQAPSIATLLACKDLRLLSLSNLAQKALLNAVFVAMPLVLVASLGYEKDKLWHIYAISTLFGFVAMGLSGALGDKRGLGREILLLGVGLFALCFVLFGVADFSSSKVLFFIAAVLFFVAFNMHEPMLQSCASKVASFEHRGAALGLSTACGYAGSFIGSIIAPLVLAYFGFGVLVGALALLCMLWFIALRKLNKI